MLLYSFINEAVHLYRQRWCNLKSNQGNHSQMSSFAIRMQIKSDELHANLNSQSPFSVSYRQRIDNPYCFSIQDFDQLRIENSELLPR